ncbi:MAG TPA: hypothetical protein VJU86_23320 [Pyrinomonadaceae bacterium]|nr:hypothetical protein [Pyrinomonadaceae bacterium]
MAISNELSSEIVNALLTKRDRSPEELRALKTMLMEVHSALQSMEEETRAGRVIKKGLAKSASAGYDSGLGDS